MIWRKRTPALMPTKPAPSPLHDEPSPPPAIANWISVVGGASGSPEGAACADRAVARESDTAIRATAPRIEGKTMSGGHDAETPIVVRRSARYRRAKQKRASFLLLVAAFLLTAAVPARAFACTVCANPSTTALADGAA